MALTLLAFVMLGAWGALSGATRVSHSADAVMSRSEQVRTVQRFLRRYVSAAVAQPYTTQPGAPARVFEGDATSMRYVAPLPMQSGHAGLYVQTIRLKNDGAGNRSLELAWRPYRGNAPSNTPPLTHLLLANLRGASFEYLAAPAFGNQGGWRDTWRAASALPLAVRIRVDPAWRTRVPFPEMVIPLHVGNGFAMQPR